MEATSYPRASSLINSPLSGSSRPSSPVSSPPPSSSQSSPQRKRSLSRAPAPHPSKRQRLTDPAHRRFTSQAKIEFIQSALDEIGWGLGDWLDELEKHQEEPDHRRSWLQYRRKAYTQTTLDHSTFKAILKRNGIDEVAYFFRKELDKLTRTKGFGQYQKPKDSDNNEFNDGSLDFLTNLVPELKQQAPF